MRADGAPFNEYGRGHDGVVLCPMVLVLSTVMLISLPMLRQLPNCCHFACSTFGFFYFCF